MNCPCGTINYDFVPPSGTRTPRIYIVGMAPGREEAEQHVPFVGVSGQVLRSALRDAGIDIESEVRFFNVVACRAVDPDNPNANRDPTTEEVENCKEYVLADIEKSKPKVIVAMGRLAASAFIDVSAYSSVTAMTKETFDYNGIKFYVAFHPSYVHRNGGVGTQVYNQYVSWFRNLLVKLDSTQDLKSLVVMSADEFLSWESPSNQLGFDIEATSLETTREDFRICGLGFATHDGRGYYVYLNDEDDFKKIAGKLKELILSHQLYVFNFSYEGTAIASKLQIHPYEWNVIDVRQVALAVAEKGSLKAIAQSKGFPDWEAENSWIIKCLDDLYKEVFTRTGKREKPALSKLRESWQSFKEYLSEKSPDLVDKATMIERLYDSPHARKSVEDIRKVFVLESEKRNYRLFFDLVPVDVVSRYCAFDAYATIKVFDLIQEKMTDQEKKAANYLNEQSMLGAAMICVGIRWNVEKARSLHVFYQEKMLHALRSFLVNPLSVQVLGLTTHDIAIINSTSDLDTLRKFFNPNSTHKTTRELFCKIMNRPITRRVYSLFLLYQEMGNSLENEFVDLKKIFTYLLREDPDPDKMKEIRKEKRKFIKTGGDQIVDIIHSYVDNSGNFLGSKFLRMLYHFEVEKLDENTIVPLYEAFNKIGGFDIDDETTWVPEFKALYDFRVYKKVFKSFSTYLWGSVGMAGSAHLIKRDDSKLVCPPRLHLDWEKFIVQGEPLNGYDSIASWHYNVNGAETNRWKSTYHVWPWQCELQDLKMPRSSTGLLAHVDYSQMEVRTIAALAKEEELLKAYEQGRDIHRFMASRIFDRPEELIQETERRYSKMMTFSILYGKTEKGVAIDFLGGDFEKAKRLVNGFYEGFPKIAEFIKTQHQRVDDGQDYVRSILGERILLRIVGSDNEGSRLSQLKRYAVNYPIQSSSSHLAAIGIHRTNLESFRRGLSIRAFGFVHDAGDFEFEAKDLYHFLLILERNMQSGIQKEFNVPVKIDIEMGVTGNNTVDVDIVEISEEKLVIEVEGPLQAFRDIKLRLELSGIDYDLEVHEIKDDFMSNHFLFMTKRAFSEKLGQHFKTVKAKMTIFNLST